MVIAGAASRVSLPSHPPSRIDSLFTSFVKKSFERAFLVEPGEDEFRTATFYVSPLCF